MPLYDYRCQKCGVTYEVRQRISDEPLTIHEGCGGAVERLISVPALQFKGTGWYVTDYGKGGSKSSTPEKSADNSGSKTEGSKSDSKTADKTGTKPSPAKPSTE